MNNLLYRQKAVSETIKTEQKNKKVGFLACY